MPHLPQACRIGQDFLARAVRAVRAAGVRRWLVIGDVSPSSSALAETMLDAGAKRIVYAGHDRMSAADWTSCATGRREVIDSIPGDFAVPGTVLFARATRRLLAPGDPVCLLLSGPLESIHDTADAAAALRCYTARLPPGSTVIATHDTVDGLDPDVPAEHALAERTRQLDQHRPDPRQEPDFLPLPPQRLRTATEFRSILAGLRLLPPGLAHTDDWRNPAPLYRNPAHSLRLAAVASIPEAPVAHRPAHAARRRARTDHRHPATTGRPRP